ncbi:MAG: YHYH protein [Gaiellaceae bacterium]
MNISSWRPSIVWSVGAAAVCCALGAVAVALGSGSPEHATTPASAGAVDPEAVPLGDGYVSTRPKLGYVDACQTSFRGGAGHAGAWIDETAKTWNKKAKPAVSGAVSWPQAYYSVKVHGGKRVVRFDDLPIDHTTGVFPIAPSDPAYQYDRNPNHIAAHMISWSLTPHPQAAKKKSCLPMGAIGVLADGVYLYNALDAAGRDAAAHEVQDSCDGHPDGSEAYHHHDIPSCILTRARKGRATLVGYALDGYGIYVVKDAKGDLPTNTDLDACHGTTSVVDWNGKATRIYHYVATLEYPYAVGCFHGTPIKISRGRAGRLTVPRNGG